MTRSIKFRAWDKEQKKMWNPNNIVVGDGVFLYDGHNTETLVHSYILRNDLIPMQFTGLLDRNGKEIYEGDILLYVAEMNTKKGRKENERHYHEVLWNEKGQWDIRRKKKDFIVTQLRLSKSGSQSKGLEIIGNIYDNPEPVK